ncbi:MAG TPA: hypothetical protein PK733_03990 [Clostridiales bacterium]|nr:hypothetical protein [Clostridiales bacterium]
MTTTIQGNSYEWEGVRYEEGLCKCKKSLNQTANKVRVDFDFPEGWVFASEIQVNEIDGTPGGDIPSDEVQNLALGQPIVNISYMG